ncbi:MAG: hypothetical protein R2830_26755 [Saprospiraceae bacterium]
MLDLHTSQNLLLIDAGKENYQHASRLVEAAGKELGNVHLKLAATNAFPIVVSFNPSDTTFLVLEGKGIDNSNVGVPSFAITFVNNEPYHIAVADDEGNFEVFAPVGETFDLVLYQACGGEFYIVIQADANPLYRRLPGIGP